MIPFIIIENMLRAARESGEVSQEELSELLLKVVMWTILALGVILLVMAFTDIQFCFRRDIQGLLKTVNYLDISRNLYIFAGILN